VTSEVIARSFIVFGALRSGTTLLRLMLDGHPKLSCPGEMDFIIDHLDASGQLDLTALEADRIYRAHEARYADHPLPNPTPQDLIARVAGPDEGMAAVIMHRHLDRALGLFPGMRVLHLMRDPRDVARSSIGMGWAGNVYYGVDHWVGTQQDWHRAQDMLSEPQKLVVFYEDLIRNPEETLSSICTFIGLDFHPDMLTYDADSTYEKPDPSLILQWQRKQTPREIGLVEAKIGPLLEQAGYPASGHELIYPGIIGKLGLWAQSKRAQWAWLIKRYGLMDLLLVKIASSIGMPMVAQAARQRIDAIKVRHLK